MGYVGHMEDVESPWFSAGGVARRPEEIERLVKTGVGAMELGSILLQGSGGNEATAIAAGLPGRVYFHDAETGATYNSEAMPSAGIDSLAPEIPELTAMAHAHRKKLIVNVAAVGDDPVSELVELTRRAQAQKPDAVLLNLGCRNVKTDNVGGRKEAVSENPRLLSRLLMELSTGVIKEPVFLRLSPQENVESAFQLGAIIRMYGAKIVSAVFTPNTWRVPVPIDEQGRPRLDVEGTCGMSGPVMAAKAREQAIWARGSLRGSGVDVVRSSGITTGAGLYTALEDGAVAGAGTTFFTEAANEWPVEVHRLLTELDESYTNESDSR